MQKRSSSEPWKEFVYSLPGDMLMGSAGIPTAGAGYLVGLMSDPSGKDAYDNELLNLIPGVGSYRLGNRANVVSKRMADIARKRGLDRHPRANNVAEQLGSLTSVLAATGAGAGIGAMASGRNRGAGAAIGAYAGAGASILAILLMKLSSIRARRRTEEEQLDKETAGRALAKYLVPGLAAHDMIMRIRSSQNYV